MRLVLILILFFAPGALPSLIAGKYQALFYYHLYRLEIDAFGTKDLNMAHLCSKTETPCNLEQFMKHVSTYKNDNTKKPGRGGEPGMVPDYGKVDWLKVRDGDDLQAFATELGKSGFNGGFNMQYLFKTPVDDRNENCFREAEKIALRSIAKLKEDGKDIANNERIKKMQLALQTHADARRCDQAKHINQAFEKYMKGIGLSVSYTEEIVRPPVEGYPQVEMARTIQEHKGKANFMSNEQKIVNYIRTYNSAKKVSST